METDAAVIELPNTQPKLYTGTGSTHCPPDVFALLALTARHLADLGMTVRTGPNKGTDRAFATGAGEQREVFLPHTGAGGYKDGIVVSDPVIVKRAQAIAAALHPDWARYNDFARKAHTMAAYLLLGKDLAEPAAYVLCYAPEGDNGEIAGACRTVIALAHKSAIPVFNLADFDVRARFRNRLQEIESQGTGKTGL